MSIRPQYFMLSYAATLFHMVLYVPQKAAGFFKIIHFEYLS